MQDLFPLSFQSHHSTWEHYQAVAREMFKKLDMGRDMVLGAILSVGAIGLQAFWGLIAVTDWQKHKWQWILSVTLPFLIVLVGHLLWRLLKAPFRVYRDLADTYEAELSDLRNYKKTVEDKEVHLEPNNPLCSTSITNFDWGAGSSGGLCLRATFSNNRKAGIPGKIAEKVGAKITYIDGVNQPFTLDGRWVRTKQPAAYGPLEDKTEILRVDFYPGTQHELDIANKVPSHQQFCHAVAYDDLHAHQLFGPIIKVKIELSAEHVYQIFECAFETSAGKLGALG